MLTFVLGVLTGFGMGFGTLVAIGRCAHRRQSARPTLAEARQVVQEAWRRLGCRGRGNLSQTERV